MPMIANRSGRSLLASKRRLSRARWVSLRLAKRFESSVIGGSFFFPSEHLLLEGTVRLIRRQPLDVPQDGDQVLVVEGLPLRAAVAVGPAAEMGGESIDGWKVPGQRGFHGTAQPVPQVGG